VAQRFDRIQARGPNRRDDPSDKVNGSFEAVHRPPPAAGAEWPGWRRRDRLEAPFDFAEAGSLRRSHS
jgi:hypothetical protein